MIKVPHQTRDNFNPVDVLNMLRDPGGYQTLQTKGELLEEACQALLRERLAGIETRKQIQKLYEANRL